MIKKVESWYFTIIWDFDDLNDYVKISYELTQDGLVIGKGKLSEVSVAHYSEGKTNLKVNCSRKAENAI